MRGLRRSCVVTNYIAAFVHNQNQGLKLAISPLMAFLCYCLHSPLRYQQSAVSPQPHGIVRISDNGDRIGDTV
jgi:hypothetical protein